MVRTRVCRWRLSALLAAVAVAVTAAPAQAAPGDPDPSFGAGGLVNSPAGAARDLVIQPDGKLVAGGDSDPNLFSAFRLARYDATGALDGGFGDGGVATTPHLAFGPAALLERGNALAIQPADGKLVQAGEAFRQDPVTGSTLASPDYALARYTASGTLDATFGSGGAVVTDFASSDDGARAVAVQADGKIVAAGYSVVSTSPATQLNFSLARYNGDGTLDASFGTGGRVTTAVPGNSRSTVQAIAIDAGGRIAVVGDTSQNTLALARYLPDGRPDSSFGTGGIVTTALPGVSLAAHALVIQGGSLVVAGEYRDDATGGAFLLARYTTAGALDPAFGNGGIVVTHLVGGNDVANDVAAAPGGQLVAAGAAGGYFSNDFGLARYNADGSLDPAFGDGGIVVDDLGGGAAASAVQVESDGKPVAAGFLSDRDGNDLFALTRYKAAAAAGDVADVGVSIAADPEPVAVGGHLTYTVSVANNGPQDAKGVSLTDTLPATGFDFDAVRTDQGFCDQDSGVVRCKLRSLLPGRAATVVIEGTPSLAETLVNAAAAKTATSDPVGADDTATSSSTVVPGVGTWLQAAPFSDGAARARQTAAVLASGQVLAVGGLTDNFQPLQSGQLYAGGQWAPTRPMAAARRAHTETLLVGDAAQCGANCGKVLVTGGIGADGGLLSSAELYDPVTGAWTPTDDMVGARSDHNAVLLSNGKVLVTGGVGDDFDENALTTAELYDPATGHWSGVAPMTVGRQLHTATLLPSGKVLVVGGYRGTAFDFAPSGALATPELYDPATNSWSTAGGDNIVRIGQTATLLKDGTVLIAGGKPSTCSCPASESDIYDPVAGTWTLAHLLARARTEHTATLLADGSVLVAGGFNSNGDPRRSAERYDPATRDWSPAGAMGTARGGHVASLLPDGSVLVAGGSTVTFAPRPLASAERYVPPGPAPAASAAAGGGGPGPAHGAARDIVRPVIRGLRVLPARFARGPRLPRLARAAKAGATIRFSLSEPATVRLTFARRRPGRRVGHHCRAATRRLRGRPRCVRLVIAHPVVRIKGVRAGANRVRFQGRLSRRRALRPGSFRLTVTATDAAGNRSRARRTRLVVLRRPR